MGASYRTDRRAEISEKRREEKAFHHKGTKINTKFTKKTEDKEAERREKEEFRRERPSSRREQRTQRTGAVFVALSRLGLLCELCSLSVLLSSAF
jgi:hypothetical protein